MDTLMLKIPSEKKDFFLALLDELPFVHLEESYTQEEEQAYVSAILESEQDIEAGRVTTHENLKKEIHTWLKKKSIG